MNPAAAALAVVFGLIGGSFLSVCAWRLPQGLSVVRPGSGCTGCGHALGAWENLPLLGYLWLRGRCRWCGRGIGWRYPLLEAGCGAAFWWSWQRAGGSAEFVRSAFFLACLLTLAVSDLEWRQLPDEITLGGWAVGMGFALAGTAQAPSPAAALAASLGGAGGLALVGLGYQKWRGRAGVGWGDIKMLGLLGAFLGVAGLMVAIFLATLVGAAAGLAQAGTVLAKRRGRGWRRARASTAVYLAREAIPFGVYLAAAGAVSWAWGARLWAAWLG